MARFKIKIHYLWFTNQIDFHKSEFLKIWAMSWIRIFWCGWCTAAFIILWYYFWGGIYFKITMWLFTECICIINLPYFLVELLIMALNWSGRQNFCAKLEQIKKSFHGISLLRLWLILPKLLLLPPSFRSIRWNISANFS